MMLTAQVNEELVEASHSLTKPVDPRCPECAATVIFKRGTGRITPHFAHKPGVVCSFGQGETPAHRRTKRLIVNWLRARGHIAHLERVVGIKPYRRADVLDETAARIFEVQFSPADYNDVLARSSYYARHGFRTTWVFPWSPGEEEHGLHRLTRSPVLESFADDFSISTRRRPRKPERSAFAFADLNGKPRLIAGSLEPWEIYVDCREVFESDGSSYEVGGYFKSSKRWIGVRIAREEPLT